MTLPHGAGFSNPNHAAYTDKLMTNGYSSSTMDEMTAHYEVIMMDHTRQSIPSLNSTVPMYLTNPPTTDIFFVTQ